MCKVSVIVPVYNAQKYIHRCVQSIIHQTYNNLEIILINDGSTDQSEEICKQLSNIDRRIVTLTEYNSGVSAARNFGIRKATGDLITFIDVDDYVEPQYIESLLRCLIEKKVDIAYCSAFIENENAELLSVEYKKNYLISSSEYDWNSEYSHCVVRGALYRASLIQGIQFVEDLSVGEDTLYFAMALNNSKKIYCLRNALYHYVIHNSLSHSTFNRRMIDEIVSWKRICKISNSTAKVACAQRCQAIIQKYYTSPLFKNIYFSKLKKDYYSLLPSVKTYYFSERRWVDLIKSFVFAISPSIYSRLWNCRQ